MSNRIVAKFGGTSVKTSSAIRSVTQIIKANPDINIVVVSAVGGITNLLIEVCDAKAGGRHEIIQKVLDIHLSLAKELEVDLEAKITLEVKRLYALDQLEEPDAAMMDYIVSLGEDLSSMIVHSYLLSQGLKVTRLDARNHIITDNHFGKATPDLAAIKQRSFPSELCIIQGFVGATTDGRTTTLGRGGSDYSAALIAEGLQAKELLIYTDVPGVYTADPNVVPQARLIPEVNFHEMAEMANFGAQILHPATLEPCVRAKIPVRILSTFEPEKTGTYINVQEENDKHNTDIKAITMRKKQVLVTIKSLKMLNAYGFIASIFSILANHKISVDVVTTSEVSVSLTIDGTASGVHKANSFVQNKELITELQKFATVIVEEDLTLVAVVGSGLTLPGVIQKTLGAIEPYMVRLVCYGASSSSISILVPKDNASRIVQILHQELLENVS
jgi:aspartate kinase